VLKKNARDIFGGCLLFVVLIFWLLVFIVPLSHNYMIFGASVTFFVFLWIGALEHARLKSAAVPVRTKIQGIVERNEAALKKVLKKCSDPYGNIVMSKYKKEIKYFYDNVVVHSLTKDEIIVVENFKVGRLTILDSVIRNHFNKLT
jgi:hypothetical protein